MAIVVHAYNPSTRCSRPTWATKNLSINKQAMELQGKSPRGCGSLERLLEKSRMLPSRCCHSPYRTQQRTQLPQERKAHYLRDEWVEGRSGLYLIGHDGGHGSANLVVLLTFSYWAQQDKQKSAKTHKRGSYINKEGEVTSYPL